MELNDYQKKAMSTCMDTCDNFSYMMLNLVGEVGEFASKVAKQIREGNFGIGLEYAENELVNSRNCPFKTEQETRRELAKEAGDILWQLSGLCTVMGWSLDDVAQMNLDKLQARKKAGTIDGNGDGICGEDRK